MRGFAAQLGAELRLMSRRPENLLVTVAIPVALLVAGGVIAPFVGREDPFGFLVPGILALAVVSTSMVSLGIATAFERYYGVLKRLIGSPLPRSHLLAAKTLSVVILEVVQVALLLGVAGGLYGYQPGGSIGLGLAVLLVGSVAFAGIGLLMAGTLRAEATLGLANGLYLAFVLLGGFVLPLERLPGSLAMVARVLPAAALADATRAAFDGAFGQVGEPLALLVAWGAVAGGAAAATFKAE